MENPCQGLLVKSLGAFHDQTTAQPKAFTIQQFNGPLFLMAGACQAPFINF